MGSFRARLGKALVDKGLLTSERLARLVHEAGHGGKQFARLLIEQHVLTEEALVGLLAEEFGIPSVSLAKYRVDPAVAGLIPERVARQYTVIPISKFGTRLVVAMADPLNIFAIDDLKILTQHAVDPVLAQEPEIRRAIEQVYSGQPGLPAATPQGQDSRDGLSEPPGEEHSEQAFLSEESGEAPVVKVIDLIIAEALRRRASDIHLEPMTTTLRVRYRIDGRLTEAHQLPKSVQNSLLTRLKIMAGLDITEWRLPQDGRFKVHLKTQLVDFRVSILPITHGGKVVMRVLDNSNLSIGLDHLGFLPESIAAFKDAVKQPHGMILVTGPTGSGKSTTLYSILSELNTPTRNITTIEDPVEYQVEGITQVPVNPDIGLTFATGLRALLRQSPDVVMIGEIRDGETADIAMKASLTGHLVLSTLHTNDAPSAVTRLIDMGVEPFLVASSITLIEAQRLVRKLCPRCRKPVDAPQDVLKRLGLKPDSPATLYQALGCHLCGKTGYQGRLGIVEVLVVDDRIRELIVAKAQSWELQRYAIEHLGMTTLHDDGLKKAMMGLTTFEEVLQATAEE
ncbi:MAG: Flp pilus assembly complex ATPase component TadA [Candidatus Omnitrophica bacterium]|nr:Flp pilus assembly complex ATPase component TadA [Candidatus Omnitrophota bacterium]